MANTYHQIYIQAVFAVKYREARITKEVKPQLMAVIGKLINETGCKTILVNGVDDHAHCFFGLKPSIDVSKVMQIAKAKSSKWINENGLLQRRFEWQEGFGAFSYSHSQIDAVVHYIENQERHHSKQSFFDEYIDMLQKYEVDFNKDYLFDELI
jgi:putative transposase